MFGPSDIIERGILVLESEIAQPFIIPELNFLPII
jgi:hypothetical protein